MKNKVSLFILLGSIVFAGYIYATAGLQAQQSLSTPTQTSIPVSVKDLTKAGYSGVVVQPPQGFNYQPNLYFWVKEDTKDNTNNLVMVSQYTDGSPYNYPLFSYGNNIHPVVIAGGRGQEGQLSNDGRVALNFSKGNYYIVIIGPNAVKVEALAAIIAGKI